MMGAQKSCSKTLLLIRVEETGGASQPPGEGVLWNKMDQQSTVWHPKSLLT